MLPTWIVGRGETDLYKEKGAKHVVEGGGLCASRNKAIEIAKSNKRVCVEMSDDLEFFQIIHQDGKYVKMSQDQIPLFLLFGIWGGSGGAAAPPGGMPEHCFC